MFKLRQYQSTALDKIRRLIVSGKKSIMVQSPTGSGKGVMLSHIINSANVKGKTVLFLVHRSEILLQVSAYMEKYGITHGIIKSGFEANYTHPVQLASFQTIIRRMTFFEEQFDIVIIDEAHHATASTYLKVINAFKKHLIIGFSATPTRQNGMGLGNLFDAMVQVASIQDLTNMGFLAPIRYFAPVEPDLTGVKLKAGDYNEKQLEPVMMTEGLIAGIVEYWMQYGENRKTVIFATGISHSMAIREKFATVGVVAEHIDGNTPAELRKDIIDCFKSGIIKIIVNCQILTEGVDVPDISCVILARPTKSLPMYMQMLGRGMRVIKGKDNMILLDHAGCVYEHGFVHEITDWHLSTTTKTENKKQKERNEKESRPITCPICNCVYTGQLKCPQCGTIPGIRQFGKDVEYIDGKLGEIQFKPKKEKSAPVTMAVKQEWYSQLCNYGHSKGYQSGWADNQYRQKFGVWPKGVEYQRPSATNPEVVNWIRHKQIAYSKRLEAEKRSA